MLPPDPGLLDCVAAARRWLEVDPDPVTRAEVEGLLAALDAPDPAAASAAAAGLLARFSGRLTFGTAGLRGPLRAGPAGMNRVVVRRAAAGLAATLEPGATVVLGHDARHNSDVFTTDSAAVLAAHGVQAIVLDGPVPTPVLAFAVRHFGADAGVMVTASHNPPGDNGYKVYLGDGAQLVPPHDRAIEAAIEAAGLPGVALPPPADGGVVVLHSGDIVGAYLDAVLGDLGDGPDLSGLRIAYTALHGVGRLTVERALARLDATVAVVPSQADPDPDFPTITWTEDNLGRAVFYYEAVPNQRFLRVHT